MLLDLLPIFIAGYIATLKEQYWTSLVLKLPVKSRRSDLQVIWHYSEVKLKIEIHRYGRPSLNTLIVNSVGQFLNFVSLVQFSSLCAVYIWLRSMLLSSGNLSLIAELIYDRGELFTKLINDRCMIWEWAVGLGEKSKIKIKTCALGF